MKKSIIAAGIQIFCNAPKQEMLKKAEAYMDKITAICPKVDLFVLPEEFYQLRYYAFKGEEFGEEPHGAYEAFLSHCAKKYHANIVGGSYAVKENGKIKNRCLVVNREGTVVGQYDKIHLCDAFGVKESDRVIPGNQLGLFTLDIGKVGVWICYDTRFPEIARNLAYQGADILCVPTAFYRPNFDQWELLVKTAAVSNVLPVIAVNQYGTLPNGNGFVGRSMLVDQRGLILAGTSDREDYFVGKIDLNYTKDCRKINPEMQNRRMDLYQDWYQNRRTV